MFVFPFCLYDGIEFCILDSLVNHWWFDLQNFGLCFVFAILFANRLYPHIYQLH